MRRDTLYGRKYVDTWPLLSYAAVPRTVVLKLEAHKLSTVIFLAKKSKPVPVHKACSMKTFAKVEAEELEYSAHSADFDHTEHLQDELDINLYLNLLGCKFLSLQIQS